MTVCTQIKSLGQQKLHGIRRLYIQHKKSKKLKKFKKIVNSKQESQEIHQGLAANIMKKKPMIFKQNEANYSKNTTLVGFTFDLLNIQFF